MKPDWKDAPGWANWRAKCSGGYWYWFEYEHIPLFGGWACNQCGRVDVVWRDESDDAGNGWRTSLEARP